MHTLFSQLPSAEFLRKTDHVANVFPTHKVDFGEGGGKKIYTKSCLEWIAILSENTVWRFTCEDLEQMFGW